jgi:hypothetical protein
MHLSGARHLLERVTMAEVIKTMDLRMEDVDDGMFNDVNFWARQLEESGVTDASPQKVMMDARNFRELEGLVRVLDSLETMGSLVALAAEYALFLVAQSRSEADRRRAPATNREYWGKVGAEINATKEYMQPLLSEWLLTGISGKLHAILRPYTARDIRVTDKQLCSQQLGTRSCCNYDKPTSPRLFSPTLVLCTSPGRHYQGITSLRAWNWQLPSRKATQTLQPHLSKPDG